MKAAIDTNLLAYAEGIDDPASTLTARSLLRTVNGTVGVLPVQVLGELFNVLVRKGGWKRAQAKASVLFWKNAYPTIDTSDAILEAALDLAADHQVPIWDAVILSSAQSVGCELLITEDFQSGFVWRGVTVANPFDPVRHPLLDALIQSASS